jgi:hypothetical protein
MTARREALATVTVLLAGVALAACGVRASASSLTSGIAAKPAHSAAPDSGVRGRASYGTCPVQRVGQTCVRPYRATITIRREPANAFVARTRASIDGRFRITLRPGRYLLVPQSGRRYPRATPRMITVRRHRYTSVFIRYDSGIR